mgnify:CR=1 FL=1
MRGIGNNNIEKTKSEFEIKFDRLYAVQEYIKAFDLCVQNIHTSYKDEVIVRAKLLLPKIKRKIELSGKNITYEDIIDIFQPLQYTMKMQNNILKVSSVFIILSKVDGKSIISFKIPYMRFFLISVVCMLLLFGVEVFIGNLLREIMYDCLGIEESEYWPIAIPFMIFIAVVTFYYIYRIYHKQRIIILQFLKAVIK